MPPLTTLIPKRGFGPTSGKGSGKLPPCGMRRRVHFLEETGECRSCSACPSPSSGPVVGPPYTREGCPPSPGDEGAMGQRRIDSSLVSKMVSCPGLQGCGFMPPLHAPQAKGSIPGYFPSSPVGWRGTGKAPSAAKQWPGTRIPPPLALVHVATEGLRTGSPDSVMMGLGPCRRGAPHREQRLWCQNPVLFHHPWCTAG